jgi:hypothetical protein
VGAYRDFKHIFCAITLGREQCWRAGQPSLLADGMPAMRWHALRDVLERGHDAQLRQPSQPGIVHYSAADAATSAGLLPSLMRIERPIDLLICYSD